MADTNSLNLDYTSQKVCSPLRQGGSDSGGSPICSAILQNWYDSVAPHTNRRAHNLSAGEIDIRQDGSGNRDKIKLGLGQIGVG